MSLIDNEESSEDSFTEYEDSSYGSRVKGSFGSIVGGLVLFLASFPLLWMNEGCAVKTARGLEQGKGDVVQVASAQIERSNNGKLIYTTGTAKATGSARDSVFGISVPDAIIINRKVEMYQWREDSRTEKKSEVGGKERKVKKYTYKKVWSETYHSSSQFKRQSGHNNPSMPYKSESYFAPRINLGAFVIPESLASSISGEKPVDVSLLKKVSVRNIGGKPGTIEGETVYFGDSENPEIGDIRIKFNYIPETTVSVIAMQKNRTFAPFPTEFETELFFLETGEVSADKIIEHQETLNIYKTWAIRVGGLLLMYAGLATMLRPLAVLVSVIPFLQSIVGFGTAIIAGGITFLLGLFTIALAWLAYRPVLAIVLIVAGTLLGFGGIFLQRLTGKKSGVSPPSPPSGRTAPAAPPGSAPVPPPPPGPGSPPPPPGI